MPNPIILLVEDNPSDLIALPDGLAALDYLFDREPSTDRQRRDLPTLVLLDLKMPKVNGLEVLQRIRSDNRTRRMPVIILTSSNEAQDVSCDYDLGANSYIRKPVDFYEFAETVKDLSRYWLNINTAPPGS